MEGSSEPVERVNLIGYLKALAGDKTARNQIAGCLLIGFGIGSCPFNL